MSNIEENIMSEEAFNELIDNFEVVETLTDYGRKAIKQNVKKLKTRIQELEEERQIVGMPVRNKRDGKIGIVLHQWENGSIAVLENISPRAINTHDSFDTLEIITDEVKHVKTKDDSIPVQKVKDKIEELKDKAKGIAGTYQYADSQEDLQEKKNKVIELRTKAEALEELLQEREDK